MNLRVGNCFLLGFHGTSLPDWLIDFETRYGLGGVILFDRDLRPGGSARNVESSEQVRELCRAVHSLESRPMVFVDQEGGKVRRLKEKYGFQNLPSAESLCSMEEEVARGLIRASLHELADHGIDFNLAPVVDLNLEPSNPNIGALGRSFSPNAEEVRRCALMFAEEAQAVGLQLCLKHYPGLGGATTDSHRELTDISGTVTEGQLRLFDELCSVMPGSAILLSHGVVREWDSNWPVSLSPIAIEKIRGSNPDVLLISDDLQMEGLQHYCTTTEAVFRAAEAGTDLMCIGNNLSDESDDCAAIAQELLERAESSESTAARLAASIERVNERKENAQRLLVSQRLPSV